MKVILFIVNISFFVITVLFAILGLYEQIMGIANAKKLLQKLHIPLSYKQTLIIGCASILLMFITFILREKLYGKL